MEQFSSSFLLDVVGIYLCRHVRATRYALYWMYNIHPEYGVFFAQRQGPHPVFSPIFKALLYTICD